MRFSNNKNFAASFERFGVIELLDDISAFELSCISSYESFCSLVILTEFRKNPLHNGSNFEKAILFYK